MYDYSELEDFVFSLRDTHSEYEILSPDFIPESTVKELIPDIEAAYTEMQSVYRIPELMGIRTPWEAPFPEKIHAIRSMVGDDETITTNSLMYAVLCIIVGPRLARIKISWSDVQFNRELYNYAEGWILLPPSMDSSFEAVNRYAKGNGVPFVLDPIKFKNLSAVRKQSDMDVDLPSKFKALAQSASWTSRGWFTWDMHQLALLLGLEIFDFLKAKIFPFLYRWEGGCGGAPPWNNLLTAGGAIFRYRRGKATKGIVGIMADANNLHLGFIKPSEALFAKNLNLALSGDARWLSIRNELEIRRQDAAGLGLPVNKELMESAERTIPQELMEKSQLVNPGDALTGSAISLLREKGYVTTELDLVTYIEDRKRLDAVWGVVHMKEIEDQILVRKQEYKEAYLETLTEISNREKLDPKVYGVYGEIEDPMSPWSLGVMERYYSMRVENASYFTSFIYNEQVRVFKTEDVEEYYSRGMSGIRNAFCEEVGSRYRPEFRRSIELPYEKQQYDAIEKWLASDTLENLLSREIPTGIGADDARILRDASKAAGYSNGAGTDGLLYLIVSSDRRLIHSVQQVLEHENPNMRIRVLGLNIIEFVAYCTGKYNRANRSRDPLWLTNLRIYNPYLRAEEPPQGPLLGALRREALYLHQAKLVEARVFYDYPNLNRNLKRFTIDPTTGLVQEMSGGFLTSARMAADRSIAAKELPEIRKIVDFMHLHKRFLVPIERRPVRLYSAKAGREQVIAND